VKYYTIYVIKFNSIIKNITSKKNAKIFFGLFILFIGFATTFGVWRKLMLREYTNLNSITDSETYHIQTEIDSRMKARIHSLDQMGKRWAMYGPFKKRTWLAEAQLQQDIFSGYTFLMWENAAGDTHWIWEKKRFTEALRFDLTPAKVHIVTLNKMAKLSTGSKILPFHKGLLYESPVSVHHSYKGTMIAAFNTRDLFNEIIPWESLANFGVSVSVDSDPLFSSALRASPSSNQPVITKSFSLYGTQWNLQVWPKYVVQSQVLTYLPALVLVLGSVVSVLLSLAFYYWLLATEGQRDLIMVNEKIERALKQSVKKFSLVFEHSALPILITRLPDQKISDVNSAWLCLFEFNKEEVVGKTEVELGISKSLPRMSVDHLKTESIETKMTKYERALKISSHVSEIEFNGQKFLIATLNDITAQVDSERKLRIAKERAEHANQFKSIFLANMSHELRTPLGAMLGFTNLLRDSELSEPERANYVEILSRNGHQLTHIINDILDLSKIESGHLVFEWTYANPAVVVREAMDLLAVKASEKGLVLEMHVEPGVPEQIVTDTHRLKQVLLNVIGNALKFTAKGAVKIRLLPHVVRVSGRPGVEFEIADTGIGIASRQQKRIFEIFVQADSSIDRNYGGSGLGLPLSKKLAHSLGGDLRLKQSVKGEGSLFSIDIADSVEHADEAKKRQVVEKKVERGALFLTGLNILVVDDSPDNRQLIRLLLTRQGARVELAENGKEACKAALAGKHDLIIMDVQMPVMDGYKATQELRRQGYQKPVIALTAHAMEEVRTKCLESGCTAHLCKPIDPEEFYTQMSLYATHQV
jgi:signal transduction histidine kinase/CheY-like chemotaxis protein